MRILFLSERSHGRFDMVDDQVGRPFFLAKHLSACADVTWAVLTPRREVPCLERRDLGRGDVRLHSVRAPRGPWPLGYVQFFQHALKLSREEDPDVVILTREMGEIVSGLLGCRITRVPWVADFTDNHATYNYGLNRPRPQGWVIRQSSFFSCASPLLRDLIQTTHPGSEVFLLPNGYEAGAVAAEAREAIRDDLGIPEGTKVLLYAGEIRTSKGIDQLLEAVRRARGSSTNDLLLVLVGHVKGTGTGFMKDIPPFARVTGALPRTEVFRWMKAADLGVLPYPSTRFSDYGFPLKLFECLSSGLPVVMTPTSSARWAASQFSQVHVARGYGPGELADALVSALGSPRPPGSDSLAEYEWSRMVPRFTDWIQSRVLAPTS